MIEGCETPRSKFDRYTNYLKRNWKFLLFALIGSTVLLGGSVYLGVKDRPSANVEEKTEVKEPELFVTDAFAALHRSLKTDKICYDDGRNGYFLHFPDDVEHWAGWWYIKAPTFHRVQSNNTWFVADIPDSELVRIYPKVEGMQCGTKTEYENK